MANIGKFNPADHKPLDSRDPLPAGWHAMRIAEDEARPTKDDPESGYLWMRLEIDEAYEPDHKGRSAFCRLNLWNKNPKAVQIAQSELTSICRALGHVGELNDTSVLHGRTMAVKLTVRTQEGYEPTNEVRDFDAVAVRFPPGGPRAVQLPAQAAPAPAAVAPAPAAPAAAHAAPAPAAPVQGGAPWKRG